MLNSGGNAVSVQDKGAQSIPIRVYMETSYGDIIVEIFTDKAPITARNFLRYVDQGLYKDAIFYRAIRPDNRKGPHDLKSIQGGLDPTGVHAPLPPIAHESTQATGLSHVNGALSAVRWDLGTAASEFFIVIGDSPILNFGGAYGEGWAVFGQVVEGMDVVCRINASDTGRATTIEYMKGQAIEPVSVRMVRLP